MLVARIIVNGEWMNFVNFDSYKTNVNSKFSCNTIVNSNMEIRLGDRKVG